MIYFLIIISIIAIVFISKDKGSESNDNIKHIVTKDSYKPTQFMTNNEIEFFNRLIEAFPDFYVFPQVAMSGLVTAKSDDFKKRNSIKNTYNRLRVDFVLYKDKKVFAIIELDDKTHVGKEDKDSKRDNILNQAGHQTFRFDSKNKPTVEQLKKIL